MKSITVYIAKLLVLLIMIILGFFQNIGGLFFVCTLGEKSTLFPVAMLSYFFAFFLPLWGISFLNNNKKWEDIERFEKGFVYATIGAAIIFYAIVILTFVQ